MWKRGFSLRSGRDRRSSRSARPSDRTKDCRRACAAGRPGRDWPECCRPGSQCGKAPAARTSSSGGALLDRARAATSDSAHPYWPVFASTRTQPEASRGDWDARVERAGPTALAAPAFAAAVALACRSTQAVVAHLDTTLALVERPLTATASGRPSRSRATSTELGAAADGPAEDATHSLVSSAPHISPTCQGFVGEMWGYRP